MDTRLDQPDSLTTSNARTQVRQSLVYDQSNEENCPSWRKSNNLLGESLSSLWQKSHFRDPPAETFPISGTSLPPPLTELEKLPTITNYQQASTTLSPTPKVEGKTFANFANFNFCLTFNFLRVQPGRSRGLGSPRNKFNTESPRNNTTTQQ